ncbi:MULTISPECIES: helix-turn-helix domain-containing protein [unclassified Methanosarcina]|uniref:helix-turn-helix domain-containing protein n=1 Tax=unclassified Methanosarcina TaxID=2644672 RepID=UPI000AC4B1DD
MGYFIFPYSLFDKHIGSCRYIYNWALYLKTKTYEKTEKSIFQIDINKKPNMIEV